MSGINSKQKIRSIYIVSFVLVVVNLFIYRDLLNHHFVSLDDHVYVTNNDVVQQGLTIESLKYAFTTFHAEFWHPITWISYLIDTEIYGLKPSGLIIISGTREREMKEILTEDREHMLGGNCMRAYICGCVLTTLSVSV